MFPRYARHFIYDIISIHYISFPRFHPSGRKFYQSIGQMEYPGGGGQLKFLTNQPEYFKMIILLVSHHVNTEVRMVFLIFFNNKTNILRHIYSRTIASLNDFFIQAVLLQVNPDTAVFFLKEYPFFQTRFNQVLTQQVGLTFIIYFVKITANSFVSDIETRI